jgi:serine/threonine protein kinase
LSIDSPGLEHSSSGRLPELGSLIADRYRILELVGHGGMGAVYRAEHVQLQRTVAVKLLLGEFNVESQAFKRFQQEARTASMLDHPNIVSVHDFGMVGARQPYLAMDYVPGISLDDVLEQIGILPLDRFRHIFAQACDALDHAHLAGVVHRDIKPSNLMLVQKRKDPDFLKIVDFGLVKLMSFDGDEKLTSSNTIVGSPLYMSPEQCRGLELDQRSDIYSLGCVMYRALSGTLPVHGESPLDTLYKHVSEEPLLISQANPKVVIPPALEMVIMKALSKKPDARQQTMAQLRDELETALSNVGQVVVSQTASSGLAAVVPPAVANGEAKKAKINLWFWLGPPVLIALFGGLIFLSMYRATTVVNYHTEPTPPKPVPAVNVVQALAPTVHKSHVVIPKKAPANYPVKPAKPTPPPVAEAPPTPPTVGRDWMKRGQMLFLQRDFPAARDAFEKALAQREAAHGPQAKVLMPVLGKLVEVCHEQHDLEPTMRYFYRFTDIYKKFGAASVAPETLRAVANTANDLAHVEGKQGKFSACESYFKWALEISKTIPDTHELIQEQYNIFLNATASQPTPFARGPFSRFRRFQDQR